MIFEWEKDAKAICFISLDERNKSINENAYIKSHNENK